MALTSSPSRSSRNSEMQSSPTVINMSSSSYELQYVSSLEQLRESNLQLTELLLDSLRRNDEENRVNRQAQMEQKKLINAVQSSRELDAQSKEYIFRSLKGLTQRGTHTKN